MCDKKKKNKKKKKTKKLSQFLKSSQMLHHHVPRVMASENATVTGTLDIVCGTLQAKLLTGDLSSGSSLCILLDSKTITPCQFQREAGKAAAKNWKTTIRYKDKPLKHFLENNVDSSGKRCCRFIIPDDAPLLR